MIEIIPAIDLIDGKCVRLTQGDYARRKTYNENPLEVAKSFEDHGLRRLHLVDLDGAKAKHIVNHKVLEQIATHTKLCIDFGGGLKSGKDLETAFNAGAQMVTGGSIAVKEPEVFAGWIEKYGAGRIILGADAREGKIAISGWTESTGQELKSYIRYWMSQGVLKVICTDIARDGAFAGPATQLYRELMDKLPGLHLIASGGVRNVEDIRELERAGIPGVIFGKAIYEGRITLKELSNLIAQG